MNRLLLALAAAAAAVLVVVPATIGLRGNTSFSQDLPVPVPSGAQPVHLVESSPSTTHDANDDRGSRSAGPRHRSDDHPHGDVTSTGTSDDHGGLRASVAAAPSTSSGSARTADSGDDHGGGGSGGKGGSGGSGGSGGGRG